MANERRINIRFSPERFDKLDEKRFRVRKTFQDIGARLFEEWLAAEGDEPAKHYLRRPADPLMEKLAMLQAHREKGLLTLVEKAIDASYALLQSSVTPEELRHLRAVAYGEAAPLPKSKKEEQPARRGRPRKIA